MVHWSQKEGRKGSALPAQIKNLLTPCLFKCKHVLPRHWCWNFCRWLGIAFSWWCLIYIVFDDMMWALPTKPCQKPAFQFDMPRIGSKETWKSLSRTVWCWSLDAWRPHPPSVARWVISWSSFAKMVSPFGEGEKIQVFFGATYMLLHVIYVQIQRDFIGGYLGANFSKGNDVHWPLFRNLVWALMKYYSIDRW